MPTSPRLDLSRLIAPQSLMVMGGVWAENVIHNCQAIGYTGDIWPVHPKKLHIADIPAFAHIDDLPTAPDASFLAINRHTCIEVVGQLAKHGAGGAICFASGFAESDQHDLQDQLVHAAGQMPVLGPNCYGFLDYRQKLAIWPDQHGGKTPISRGVALFSQSSNIAINLSMQSRGLPIAQIFCLGNQAMVSLQDLAYSVLDDPDITALGFYIEGIDNPQAFAQLVHDARQQQKAVVVIKSGLSLAGQRATASHTASLAGGGIASLAFFHQCGATIADDLEEFIEILKLAHRSGVPPKAQTFCSISCSGGEAALMADLFKHHDVPAPAPTQQTSDNLHALLGDLVTISNPLDYHTFIWGQTERICQVILAMIKDYDVLYMVIDFPRPDRCDQSSFMPAVQAIIKAQSQTKKWIIPLISISENIDETMSQRFIDHGMIPLCGLSGGVRASQKFLRSTKINPSWLPYATQCKNNRNLWTLSEAEAKQELSSFGIEIPQSAVANDIATLRQAATTLPAPWVQKGLGFAHKTETGAVRLGIEKAKDLQPISGATGYLLEEMITGSVAEILVSIGRDDVYGLRLTMGFGGIWTELLEDTCTLILPVSNNEIVSALNCLRLSSLLNGYRGQPAANIPALVKQIQLLCQALEERPDWHEIEINPILVTPDRAVSVDALVTHYTEDTT